MRTKDTLFSTKQSINCKGVLLDFSTPRVMGILNVTPDSFYDGGRYLHADDLVERVSRMLTEGADIIDVGAYSSRPGADDVPPGEERSRLAHALKSIRDHFPDAILSVDTFRADTAEFVAAEFGVAMINDISGGLMDEAMFTTVGRLKLAYVMMHMQGNPKNMQKNPVYHDITRELLSFFAQRANQALQSGIEDIIIDPGFGFGKTVQHNFTLLRDLKVFAVLGRPIMAGLSRKSMVYKSLGITPEEALNGTTVLHTLALHNGAGILRVHDVKEAREAVRLYTLYRDGAEGIG